MTKYIQDILCPIHGSIAVDSDAQAVLDSRPFQRLRYIHQLALTLLIYPTATHKRFEHSLGVMELASRVFDIVTNRHNLSDQVKRDVPEATDEDELRYWRRVTRLAGLCHDLGHLPFSHAAERELLPSGWNHERLTRLIIRSPSMESIWKATTPPVRAEDVEKLAVGPEKAPDLTFSTWETILSDIIVGDAFGVDRIDYLLRDSFHAGVAYGRIDHCRLIESLRILPDSTRENAVPALGVEERGLAFVQALLRARHCMYSRVYFHPLRRIYDIHLKDFLALWLENGTFPVEIEGHLKMTDKEVSAALLEAAVIPAARGHDPASRIVRRQHFEVLYERTPADMLASSHVGHAIYEAATAMFGAENVRYDGPMKNGENGPSGESPTSFPVLFREGRVVNSRKVSEILSPVRCDFVFIHPDLLEIARAWLEANRVALISATQALTTGAL
jgi:HD superfamily phosphohydrolase